MKSEIRSYIIPIVSSMTITCLYVLVVILMAGCQTVPDGVPSGSTGGTIDTLYTVLLISILVLQIFGNAGIVKSSSRSRDLLNHVTRNGNGTEIGDRIERLLTALADSTDRDRGGRYD